VPVPYGERWMRIYQQEPDASASRLMKSAAGRYARREENIAAEAALDGIYVIRTSVDTQ